MSLPRPFKKKPSHPESEMQRAMFRWFDFQYPDLRHNLFAIPNGGRRGEIEARILKGEGVRAGVADMCFFYHGYTAFIEVKTQVGVQNAAQKAFQQTCGEHSVDYFIVKSTNAFISLIRQIIYKTDHHDNV